MKNLLNITIFTVILAILSGCNGGEGNSDVDSFLDIEIGGGDGGVGNTALSFSPAAFDYGDVGLAGSGSRTFNITNSSDRQVFFSNFSGANATFSVSSTSCNSGAQISPGGTCTVTIDFTPSTGGSHLLTINANYGLSAGDSTLIAPVTLQGSAGTNAPSNYVLSDVQGTTATISWTDNSNNETSFELERCDGISCASSFVSAFSTTVTSNTTSYQFTGLTEGTYYRYRVRALTATSQSDWLEGGVMITFGGITSVDDNGTGSADISSIDCRTAGEGTYVSLSWNAVGDATNYFVFDTSGGSNTLLKTVAAPATSTIVTGISVNTAQNLLVTVATSAGFNSLNTSTTNITSSSYLPCTVLGKPNPASTTSGSSFYFPSDAHIYNGRMYVVDRQNHRVLIWNTLPTSNSDPADIVIGQATLSQNYINNTSGSPGVVSAQSLNFPYAVWAGNVGGTDRMIVADTSNHRVLIWNSIPTTNHAAANIVIGQGNFTTAVADSSDVTRGLHNPYDVWSDGTKLYVADFSNNRVLIWNTFPTTNFQIPDVYLGQDTNNGQGQDCGTANRMREPRGVWSDGTTLIVSNTRCQRVSVYNSVPVAGNPAPDTILGNTGLTAGGTSTAANRVNTPWKVRMNAGKVYVADHGNNRIKVWNSLPAAGNHGVASDYVVGLSNTGNGGGTQQNRLDNPIGFTFNGTSMYVADFDNHRLMGYNTLPTGDATNANFQIGQEDFGREVFNNSEATAANNFDFSEGTAYDGTQFFAADVQRNRVLVWNGIPSYNQAADFVIGQGNFNTTTAARSQSQLNAPRGICTGGGKLWVPDYNNRRVMVFDLPITTNSPNASGVLGQTSWTTNTSNTGMDRVNLAIKCHYDGTKFFVVDRTYDRVLIWNSLPNLTTVTDNPPADVRIGTNTGNQTTQNGLRDPVGIYSDGTRVFVADTGNHRVVAYDPIPTTNDANGTFYLGGNTGWTNRAAGVSASAMNSPIAVAGNGTGKIYVLDENNGRVLGFNNPTANNDPATELYGKDNFTNTRETWDSSMSFSSELRGLLRIDNRLFVGDVINSRVIGFPHAP